ncbi:MAG TPA: MT-A70 family methyltransferase [Candidatus Paceibacterota bacterium]|nr:MT-A70 family methyltransferase [Candidatus Paceibacterota bacterium]
MKLPNKKYKIIYADPPWKYETWTELKTEKLRKKCGSLCYDSMSIKDICDLPINKIADEECILFLWITMPKLNEVFKVIESWGFIYKTVAFTWVKTNKKKGNIYSGLGHWTLANPELCLLCTHKKFPKRINLVKQLVFAPKGIHSRKPEIIRNKIVELVGDLPRIELFARERVEGWDAWGNEVPKEVQKRINS